MSELEQTNKNRWEREIGSVLRLNKDEKQVETVLIKFTSDAFQTLPPPSSLFDRNGGEEGQRSDRDALIFDLLWVFHHQLSWVSFSALFEWISSLPSSLAILQRITLWKFLQRVLVTDIKEIEILQSKLDSGEAETFSDEMVELIARKQDFVSRFSFLLQRFSLLGPSLFKSLLRSLLLSVTKLCSQSDLWDHLDLATITPSLSSLFGVL